MSGKLERRRNNNSGSAKEHVAPSTRSAGFGGSSASLLKLYTDEAQGLKVDPLVVLFLAVAFLLSVIALHVVAKLAAKVF